MSKLSRYLRQPLWLSPDPCDDEFRILPISRLHGSRRSRPRAISPIDDLRDRRVSLLAETHFTSSDPEFVQSPAS
jgi:hypothetical protein